MFMDRFAIINNRKRAIIALIHSVFFLGVAGVQLAISHAAPFSLRGEKVVGGVILLTIYVIVTTVLLILLRFSRCTKERLYFAFCSASAGFGLVRIWLGDPVTSCQRASRAALILRSDHRYGNPPHAFRTCRARSPSSVT